MASDPLKNFDLKAHYESFQRSYGIDPATGEAIDAKHNTKIGNQFDAAQLAFETGARLLDAKDLLSANMEIIANPNSSNRSVKKATNQISGTILPVIELAVKSTQNSAQKTSPIPGAKYAFQRMEKKRQKEAECDADAGKQPKLARVKEFLRKSLPSSSKSPGPAKKSVPRRRAGSRRAKYQLPLRTRRPPPVVPLPPTPPAPDNTQTGVYGVGEFLQKINERTEEGTKQRVQMIDAMRGAPFKYLPVSRATVYRYIKAHKKGVVFQYDAAWPGMGRKPLLADDALAECAKKIVTSHGQKHMKDQVNEILVDALRKQGRVVGSSFRFNETTLNNYRALLAKTANITLTDESTAKSNGRFTAEHSLIGTVAYLIVVAMTHFYVVEEETVEWRETLAKIPEEDKLLYHMVQAFHGGKPIRARPSFLIFCSDDCTEFLTEGLQPNRNSEVGLVSQSSLRFRGSESTYHHEDSKKFDGLRCKSHLITNAAGDAAPAVFAFCGLTERDMPKTDFIVWEIPGLCPGGSGVGGSAKVGYVLFMRGKDAKGMEKRRFRWIRENVFFKFVKDCRRHYLKIDDTGAPIPEEHVAVAWNDGDNSQLATIIEEGSIVLYTENGVMACKHGAGTTAGQQANDQMVVFKMKHKLNKTITVVHIPADRHPLKCAILAQFAAARAAGLLVMKKERQCVDYLAKQQVILTRTLGEPERVVRGHIANGMLDEATRTVPVLANILRINKRVNTQDQQKLVFDTFPKLMDYAYHHGMRYIPDEVFLALGYPVDVDAYGEERVNENGISREWRQRAKCLTGADAIQQRAKRALEIEIERKRKADENEAKSVQKASEDRATVERLCGHADVSPSRENLVHVELEHFNRELAPALRAFVANRDKDMMTVTSTSHLKKPRGTALAEALQGASDSLLVAAHKVRTNPSRAVAPSQQASDAAAVVNVAPLVVRFSLDPDAGAVKPSVILCNSHKVDILCAIFDANDKLTKTVRYFIPPTNLEPEKSLVAKADLLSAMLQARLPNHIRLRVKLAQHSNWCLPWIYRNLPIVAAYMVYVGHLKEDISCLDASKCLLAKPSGAGASNFLLPTNTEAALSGAYLHFDKNEEEWVRSGSSMGKDGFKGRLDEHVAGAKAERNDSNSRFYHLYPHSTSARANNPARRGYFEYLQPYLAASFSKDEASPAVSSKLFSKDYREGGIFFYTDEEKERVRKTSFSKKKGELKFMQMAAYLFELGYDLALSLKHNVSESPGFEGCGLIFDKKRATGPRQ